MHDRVVQQLRHMLDMYCTQSTVANGFKRWTSSTANEEMRAIVDEPPSSLRKMTAIYTEMPETATRAVPEQLQ